MQVSWLSRLQARFTFRRHTKARNRVKAARQGIGLQLEHLETRDLLSATPLISELFASNNVGPSSAISAPNDGFQGVANQARAFTLTASDPSPEDQAAGFTYQVTWGDGSAVETFNGLSGLVVNHTFTAEGPFNMSVVAVDKNGTAGPAGTRTITIQILETQGNYVALGGTSGNDLFGITAGFTVGDYAVGRNGIGFGTSHPTSGFKVFGGDGTDGIVVDGLPSTADTFTIDLPVVLLESFSFTGDSLEIWNLRGFGGNDLFKCLNGAVNIDGGGGVDKVTGPNAPNTWTINKLNGGDLNSAVFLTNVEMFEGGTGNDTFKFLPPGALRKSILGGVGSDVIDYSNYGSAVSVTLQGGTATGLLSFKTIESVIGSALGDTLIGLNKAANWNITAANAGTVGSYAFASFENLQGGTRDDIFKLAVAGSIGAIAGGGGVDTLDYLPYMTPVTVDLSTGAATGTLGVSAIQNVNGGSASDSLTGNTGHNLLSGNEGNDTIHGGPGNDILLGGKGNDSLWGDADRDILVGGAGLDTLDGGLGDDILIGAKLSYYSEANRSINLPAFQKLRDEWTRTDLGYNDRLNHLNGSVSGGQNGNSVLNSDTLSK